MVDTVVGLNPTVFIDLKGVAMSSDLLTLAPYGADSGYATEGDILPRVTQTADNVDLNVIWQEIQTVLGEWNAHRSAVVDLLSYWHTSPADAVPQALTESSFEEASEFGEPTSLRPPSEYVLLGYQFKDYDRATRFTWKFLRDADSRQVRASADEAMRADTRLVTGTILRRLFDPTAALNEWGHTCYGLWNGTDGATPPSVLGATFASTHSHYVVSGATDIDSGDLESSITHVREHGYGLTDSNEKLFCLVNPAQSEDIQSFRANVENNNSQKSKWDFIPANNQPAFIIAEGGQLVGNQPPGRVFNLPSVGSYGPLTIVESNFIPAGYFVTVASAGPGAASNAVGVRQHTNTQYQGLRTIPGNQQSYPLIESFYTRSFGVGVRHRGAAVVTQLSAPGAYVAPTSLVLV